MKKTVIALLVILALLTWGCGKEGFLSSIDEEDYSNDMVSQEEIEKYLLETVPEISDYATYIEQESDGQARLYIRVSEKEEVVVGGLINAINCYPVYVGEKWATHTANWDWFYVSENLDAVYWYDVVNAEACLLEDWRNGDEYSARVEIKTEVETEPRQAEPSHNLKNIDWATFQTRLSDKEIETLQKYLPVLTGGEFTWIERHPDPDNVDAYLHKPRQAVISDLHIEYEQVDTLVNSIAFADVFQNGTQDVILYLYNIGGHYLILHEENGIIYGIDYPVRWFQGLQEDGLYCSSGGAGNQKFYRMTFENGDYTEHEELSDANMQNDVDWYDPFY